MKVAGFTFVRNAVKYDYPVVESIQSLLPLVEELVVALGNSEDHTRQLIEAIGDPKIKIFDTLWDDSLREGGRVLAVETDKALAHVSKDANWVFYLQADEVLHEADLPIIREAMEFYLKNPSVEGLLLHYHHFFGTYDYIGDNRTWYRHEIRAIKPHPELHAYRDAQGFRIGNRKINVAEIPAHVYHYGWVKPPEKQQAKQQSFHKLWHDDQWMKKNVSQSNSFNYQQTDSLRKFHGSHPAVMKARIARLNWDPGLKEGILNMKWKKRLLYFLEKWTGWRPFEYRNFNKVARWHPLRKS
jgi:hypothetical protein